MILRTSLYSAISTIAFLLPYTSADVSFSSPSAGQTITGSDITVTFADGSASPALSTFTGYTLQLCAGGNTDSTFTPIVTFTSSGTFSASSITVTIPDLTVGDNTKNAYFLRSIGIVPGGTIYNFSDRFTLSSMTGQFSAAVQQGLASVSGTAGPATENNMAAAPAA
ncbi:Cell wall synthesis protein kre9 precursor, partial [Elasticomyces elasticus]